MINEAYTHKLAGYSVHASIPPVENKTKTKKKIACKWTTSRGGAPGNGVSGTEDVVEHINDIHWPPKVELLPAAASL
jgi:hypothetical protein